MKKVVHLGTHLAMAILVVISIGSVPAYCEEQCLKEAWTSFNNQKYEEAITASEVCVDEFGKKASRDQAKLNAESVPQPPTGSVSDAERTKIFSRGLINDVGTALYVKGRSAEHLYRKGGEKALMYKKIATEAYEAVCEYSHARTWDPKGWFWSPCEAAKDRLPLD